MDEDIKRLIPEQRCKDEALDFIEERAVDGKGVSHVDYKIIDGSGVVYKGVLQPNGAVFDGYMTHLNAETFERFDGPADTLCGWWSDYWWYEILRDQNGEIYVWKRHKQVSPSEYIMHLPTARALADFIFDLEEPQILEFTHSGHWAVCLPEEIRVELIDTAYHSWEDKSRRELIVERLRQPPLTDEEKREFLRARAPLVEKIRQRRAAADDPNMNIHATVEG